MTQPSLLTDLAREERPWKVVRRVSKQVYAELRRSGRVSKRIGDVIVSLAYYRNSRMEWPTAAELARFMFERKRLVRDDARLVAPRLTELTRGEWHRLPDGSRVRRGGGLLTSMPPRRCHVTATTAHPIAIREAGARDAITIQPGD